MLTRDCTIKHTHTHTHAHVYATTVYINAYSYCPIRLKITTSEGKCKLVPCTLLRHEGIEEVQLHLFLAPRLDAGKWSTSRQGRFIPEKNRFPPNRRLGRPQERVENVLSGNEVRIGQFVI